MARLRRLPHPPLCMIDSGFEVVQKIAIARKMVAIFPDGSALRIGRYQMLSETDAKRYAVAMHRVDDGVFTYVTEERKVLIEGRYLRLIDGGFTMTLPFEVVDG